MRNAIAAITINIPTWSDGFILDRHIRIAQDSKTQIIEAVKGMFEHSRERFRMVFGRGEFVDIGCIARDETPEVVADHFLSDIRKAALRLICSL